MPGVYIQLCVENIGFKKFMTPIILGERYRVLLCEFYKNIYRNIYREYMKNKKYHSNTL